MSTLPPHRAKDNLLALSPGHFADLRRSGLSDDQIRACGFRTEADPKAVAALLGWTSPATKLGPCLVIPYFTSTGEVMGYARVKPDQPRKDRTSGKPVKYESPRKAVNRAYFPPGTRAVLADVAMPLLLTEGEKKAAKADQEGFQCVGLVGVYGFQKKRPKDAAGQADGPRELIPDLAAVAWAGRKTVIAFDSDIAEKDQVRWAEWHLAETLTAAGAVVRVIRLPPAADGGKQGLDDFLVAAGRNALRDLVETAAVPVSPRDMRHVPEIVIGTDQYRVNEQAVESLASEADLFQRCGTLVTVTGMTTEEKPSAAVRRATGVPAIRILPRSLLQERLTRCARWVKPVARGEGVERVPAHPPPWCVNAVSDRGDWSGIPRLEAVVGHPVFLPDGTLLAANGYHKPSNLYVALPPGLRLTMPDRPSRDDVAAAVATLDDPVCNFPFETPAHRATWFAALLTPLAWHAFTGPAPLFLFDGNQRGVGKGLLADVIALVLTGRRFPTLTYTRDKEELRKKITSLALTGETIALFDNLAGPVGDEVLDQALTSGSWQDRLLGGNTNFTGPLNIVWYGTGNNVRLVADTARRVCHCRLVSPDERPELNSQFRHPKLRQYVVDRRGSLLSAAATILAGWFAADRPTARLPAWGSFEEWSDVVREAVVFAGLADPGETRLTLQPAANPDTAYLAVLLTELEKLDPARRGLTTGEILRQVVARPSELTELKLAVEGLCGKLCSLGLGYKLRDHKDQNIGGRKLVQTGMSNGSMRWTAVPVVPGSGLVASSSGGTKGDGGDQGDVVHRFAGESASSRSAGRLFPESRGLPD